MKEIIYLGVGLSICVIIQYLYFETSIGEQNIPKIIIQTWKNKTLPDKCINYVQSVKEKNPDYEYLFFDDIKARKFIADNFKNNILDRLHVDTNQSDVLYAYDYII